jgi:hypothetical protein
MPIMSLLQINLERLTFRLSKLFSNNQELEEKNHCQESAKIPQKSD